MCSWTMLYHTFAGSAHNRYAFVSAARRALLHATLPRLTVGDCHSLLQMMCPDFPQSPVQHAWLAACAAQEATDAQQRISDRNSSNGGASIPREHFLSTRLGRPARCDESSTGGGSADWATGAQEQEADQELSAGESNKVVVSWPVFLTVFQVAWIYEHYFLRLRAQAFDRDKTCMGLERLKTAMDEASSELPSHFWPLPPSTAVNQAVALVSRSGSKPAFPFGDLVRALCLSSEVRAQLQRQNDAWATAASVALATARTAAAMGRLHDDGGGSSSSSDDGRELKERAIEAMGSGRASSRPHSSHMSGALICWQGDH